jgi:large repetitive protein
VEHRRNHYGDWLNFAINNCTSIADTVNVFQKPKPQVNLGKDTSVCKTKPIVLSTPFYTNATYSWNTGESSSQIKINNPGVYSVSVTQDCEATDTINVFAGDCEFFIPNAFTPNGNSINDVFGPATTFNTKNYEFVIFDRWGNKVFETKNVLQKWNGTYKGKPMPMGSYFWNITYTTLRGISKYEQGMVTLIR